MNIFQDDISKSYIKMSVKNNENMSQVFSISKETIDTYKGLEDNIIEDINLTSDFINYKYIFRFFNFLNRDTIDLFELFRYEIFHFKIDDICLKDLLDEIESIDNEYVSEGVYNNKLSELSSFNSNLQSIISRLDLPTNQYIKKFALNTIKISFSSIDASYEELDKQVKKNKYKYKYNLPQININILQKKGNEWISIPKPQSFFNEAKLTAIALSVRLAITQIKLKNSPSKLFVLDDLLVSLDMSNRDSFLDILLNDTTLKDYQKIILTHDRAFFEMARQKFNYVEKGDWKYFEMYVDDKGAFETPFILPHRDYFEKAEYFLLKYDYSACANYLRKESERLLKALVCHHIDLSCEETKNLQTLIDKVKTRGSLREKENIVDRVRHLVTFEEFENFINFDTDQLDTNESKRTFGTIRTELKKFNEFSTQEIEGLNETLTMLEEFKSSILNPQSHDDNKVPLYKKELEDTVQLIKKIKDKIENP